jgi:hypothetical protein
MTPQCKITVDKLIETNETFASLTVEQLLYAAIKDTDYETVFHVLFTTDWTRHGAQGE